MKLFFMFIQSFPIVGGKLGVNGSYENTKFQLNIFQIMRSWPNNIIDNMSYNENRSTKQIMT